VGPRFGPLYASAVLRPLAEQLVAELDVRPGDTACDLMCDSGTLGAALGGAVGRLGSVLLVDTDKAVLEAAARDVADVGSAVSTAVAGARGVALAGASYDRVASLCTVGFWPGASLLAEAERLTRPDGIAAVLSWDAALPPPHESALVDALRDHAGVHSRFLDQCLPAAAVTERARWERTSIRDVVRFDGIAHYWAAMVTERPLPAELAGESDLTLSAVRAACERALHPFTAVDGTMRIPVVATLLRRRATDQT
jgi:SAM-dependent methyltransferase